MDVWIYPNGDGPHRTRKSLVRVSTVVKAAYIPAHNVIIVYVYLIASGGTNNAKSGKRKHEKDPKTIL